MHKCKIFSLICFIIAYICVVTLKNKSQNISIIPEGSLMPLSSQPLSHPQFLASITIDWFCVFLDFIRTESLVCWLLFWLLLLS